MMEGRCRRQLSGKRRASNCEKRGDTVLCEIKVIAWMVRTVLRSAQHLDPTAGDSTTDLAFDLIRLAVLCVAVGAPAHRCVGARTQRPQPPPLVHVLV